MVFNTTCRYKRAGSQPLPEAARRSYIDKEHASGGEG